MKKLIILLFVIGWVKLNAQELYVFSEPASNMPAHSISAKLTSHFVARDKMYDKFSQRYMPEVMFGINKKLMIHASATFADMHTDNFQFESVSLYGKYRFLSNDDLHTHFRMAVFADASYTRSPFHYDEITLMGDKSGVEAGIIATQLWHRFALSGTLSHTQVLDKSRNNKVLYIPQRNYQSINYIVSGGYLLFPREYRDYRQLNVNLYTEFIGQQVLDDPKYYIDVAPAVQFIFNSNFKLNVGYRMQLGSSMARMTNNSWVVSVERTFLNALK